MKICTYNVNSIRVRKDLLLRWLGHRNNDLDIVCFQEIKVVDEKFPYAEFESLGFVCEVFGQKTYNGVAICSKLPLRALRRGFADLYWDEQKRLVACEAQNVTLINVYAPHGDLRGSEKYRYKLEWYDKFRSFLEDNFAPGDKMLVLGDFNVARTDADVYDPEAVKDGIGTMIEEREAFTRMLDWGLTDTFRHLYPTKRQFTWWDYIGAAIWRNEGMRIDYVLCTQPLLSHLTAVEVDLWPRRRRTPTPSDHAPVILTLDL